MERTGREVGVGIFVLVGLVTIGVLILQYGKFRERFMPLYRFDVRFQNVGQVAPGAPVIKSGVTIGKVDRIRLEETGSVRLTLAVWKGIDIGRDAKFTIKQSGLLGDLNVVVIPQSKDALPIQPGEVAQGDDPTDIQDTLEQAAQVVIKVKVAAESIASATQKLDEEVMNPETLQQVRAAISNIAFTSAQTQKLVEDADAAVNSAAIKLDQTLADLNRFATNLSLASAKTLDIINANEEDIHATVDNIRTSSERLETLLADVQQGKGTIGKLLVDESFHNELKRLVTNLRRFGVLRYKDAPLPETTPPTPEPQSESQPSDNRPAKKPIHRSKPGGL